MLKFFVGILMVAFGCFVGYQLTGKYRKRRQFFQQLAEFNERFLSEVSYYRRPIKEFVAIYHYQGEFNLLLCAFFNGIEKRSIIDENLLNRAEFSFIEKKEKQMVFDYFSMLGKGDSSSQKGYFSSVNTQLKNLKNEADNDCKKYVDLYIKLGFLCGLFILILIV